MARFRQDAKVAALKRSPLFEGLTQKQLVDVARLTDDLDVPPGTVLCKEGDRGREFFVIVEGRAVVTRGGDHIAVLSAGDFFGEIALLEPVTRTATVTAASPLRFFLVGEREFRGLLDTDSDIERKLLRTLARRLLPQTADPITP